MKRIIYNLLQENINRSKWNRLINNLIVALIIISILMIILQSVESLYRTYIEIFRWAELIIVCVFSAEYLLRIYSSNFNQKGHFSPRLKYILSPMAIIDLLSILPFFLPLIIPLDLRFLRIVRLSRILRVLKLNRYSKALETFAKVIKKKKDELITALILMIIVLLVASILMYNAENLAQPEAFPNIFSSFWWAICTLTTVGYGDVYPITIIGKTIASVITVLGIGLIALPTAIISSAFLEEIQKENIKQCPHCGEEIEN